MSMKVKRLFRFFVFIFVSIYAFPLLTFYYTVKKNGILSIFSALYLAGVVVLFYLAACFLSNFGLPYELFVRWQNSDGLEEFIYGEKENIGHKKYLKVRIDE